MKKIILVLALLSGAALATLTTTSTSVTCPAGNSCAVPFKFLDATHLRVTVNGVLKTLGTHYTVTGAGTSAGGTVTFTSAQAYPIVVTRVVPLTQPTGLRSQTTFNPVTHENALDRIVMQLQQLNNGLITPTTSWAGLSVADRFADIYNIKDFGAVCDGSTSDLSAIQATVSAAVVDHKVVFIPPSDGGCVIPTGTNVLGDVVSVTGTVSIFGDGPNSTIYIKGSTWRTADPGYFHVTADTEFSNVSFSNMRFLGDYDVTTAGPGAASGAIVFAWNADPTAVVNNVRVESVIFEKLGGAGVKWSGGDADPAVCCQSTTHLISNNLFVNSGSTNDQINPYSNGVRGVQVVGNTFRDVRGAAIELSGMNHMVLGNKFINVHNAGILTVGTASSTGDTLISNNTMVNVGVPLSGTERFACIQIGEGTGSPRYRIMSNSLQNCGDSGIWTTGGITDLVVDGNVVDCAGFDYLSGTSSATGLNLGNGIVRGKITNNYVLACRSGGTSRYGVIAPAQTTDTYVDGNVTSGTFTVKAFLLPSSLGAQAVAGGTRNYIGKNNYDLATGQWVGPTDYTNTDAMPVLALNSTEPSVAGWDAWVSSNTASTTIVNFVGGRNGQILTVQFYDGNTCLAGGGVLQLRGGTKCYNGYDAVSLIYGYGVWKEIGMDRNGYVMLSPSASQTGAAVSLTSSGVALTASSTNVGLGGSTYAAQLQGAAYPGPFSGGTSYYGGSGVYAIGGAGFCGGDSAPSPLCGGDGVYATGGRYGVYGSGGLAGGAFVGSSGPGAIVTAGGGSSRTSGDLQLNGAATSTPSSPVNGQIWVEQSGGVYYLKAYINSTAFYFVMATSTKPY